MTSAPASGSGSAGNSASDDGKTTFGAGRAIGVCGLWEAGITMQPDSSAAKAAASTGQPAFLGARKPAPVKLALTGE